MKKTRGNTEKKKADFIVDIYLDMSLTKSQINYELITSFLESQLKHGLSCNLIDAARLVEVQSSKPLLFFPKIVRIKPEPIISIIGDISSKMALELLINQKK